MIELVLVTLQDKRRVFIAKITPITKVNLQFIYLFIFGFELKFWHIQHL